MCNIPPPLPPLDLPCSHPRIPADGASEKIWVRQGNYIVWTFKTARWRMPCLILMHKYLSTVLAAHPCHTTLYKSNLLTPWHPCRRLLTFTCWGRDRWLHTFFFFAFCCALLNPATSAGRGLLRCWCASVCVSVCVSVCLSTRYLKNYLTNQLFGGGLSSDPEMKWLDIEKNRPGGGGGGGCECVCVGGGRNLALMKKIWATITAKR